MKQFLMSWVVLTVWLVAACASPRSPSTDGVEAVHAPLASGDPAPAGLDGGSQDYRIGSQDLLELQVFGIEALNRTVRVNSRGLISLPLIGVVQAAGLTSEELEAALAEKLAQDYLQDPQVSVFIKEFTSQRVTVDGAVKSPGIYPLKGQTSLLQVLATAKGLTSVADPSSVKIFRVGPNGMRDVQEFDLDKIRSGEVRDPEVRNDDIVQVGESTGKVFAKGLIEFILPFRFMAAPLY
jgi:polysaccharide export outer membrane protein